MKTKLCFHCHFDHCLGRNEKGEVISQQKTGMLPLPSTSAWGKESNQTVTLDGTSPVPEPCNKMPGNGSSTHIFSAWLQYFPKYFPLTTGCFRYLARLIHWCICSLISIQRQNNQSYSLVENLFRSIKTSHPKVTFYLNLLIPRLL